MMGIAKAAAELLFREHSLRPFHGAALELGRQDCAFSFGELVRLAARSGIALRRAREASTEETVGDRELFRALGFDEVTSLDASDFEGADVVHDLNMPLPEALHGRYDLVYNGGTLEHVFDVRASLANVHRALAVGGRAVHVAPVSNLIDHGFYSFSPTLFLDYYSVNQYVVRETLLFQARDFASPWTAYRYQPGCLDALSSRFHDVRVSGVTVAGLWVMVEKTAESTGDIVPQQGHYARRWTEARGASLAAEGRLEPAGFARAMRDAKRRLDRALPAFNPRHMPSKAGVFG